MFSLQEFQSRLHSFCSSLPTVTLPIALEIRNPNYLNEAYFRFLNDSGLSHVFLEGYFMPPVWETYNKFKHYIKNFSVIRLHAPDRSGIEEISNEIWDKIYINRDDSLRKISEMIFDFSNRDTNLYINVNNHFEGSSPLTIKKLKILCSSLI